MLFCALGVYETASKMEAAVCAEDTQDDRFVEACHNIDYVEYLVDLLIMGDSYERTEVIDMMLTDGKLQKLQKHLKKVRKEEKHIGEQEL